MKAGKTAYTQKSIDKVWNDEKGIEIPYSRTTKLEREMERRSGQLLSQAEKVNLNLRKFKETIHQVCQDIYSTFMEENNGKTTFRKGNFTWYNFNRSVKIEVNIHEQIVFDDLGIIACKDKLDTFLSANVESKNEFIKQLILDAFETSRGTLDSKKTMSLLRYKSKIKDAVFQEAMTLLENSIRRSSSKTYFRIWAKDEEGIYQNIDLNFSSI